MSDALSCDGPGCDNVRTAPSIVWAHLWLDASPGNRLDFCSWPCLGAFVMEASSTVSAFEQSLAGTSTEPDTPTS